MADYSLEAAFRIQAYFDSRTPVECQFCGSKFYVTENVGAWNCYQLIDMVRMRGDEEVRRTIFIRADHRADGDPFEWTPAHNMSIPRIALDQNRMLFANMLPESVVSVSENSAREHGSRYTSRYVIEKNISVQRFDQYTAEIVGSYPESQGELFRLNRVYNALFACKEAEFVAIPIDASY